MPSIQRAIIALGVLSLAGIGALRAQATTQAPYPPTGTLVDVGGYRVHLNCTGAGRPTVVVVGSGYSFDWSLVQTSVSSVTRVCTYDPAGSAWSDAGPAPNCDGRVLEIHRMLQTAGVAGPFVFVGHSIGAVFARMYAERFPKDVAGIVLSDHAGRYRLSTPPATPFGLPPAVPSPAQSLQNLPPAAQALHRWATTLSRASSIPLFNQCISQLDTSKANRPGALGNRPLVVLGNSSLAASDDYRRVQAQLLALSHRATPMTAATYGHETPLDDPQSLVRAIRSVIDDVRKQ